MNCKNKSFITKRKAFTLIELLIVIAIIGILFIVLISKVDFATDKSKATGVQTDFRSFQVAFETVAKENAGFNTFGWDTGDLNANGKRDSYDEGDTNKDNIQNAGEIWTGHKVPGETFTKVFTLVKPGTTFETDGYDIDAIAKLETAINANLDPKLHITIATDGKITMANGAQDPWNKEYHGEYITNAEVDKKDQGAIVIYSDGANNEFGSEHKIANGIVSITVPGDNKAGKDDYSMAVVYTYVNGHGEVNTSTSGFSQNQGNNNNKPSDPGYDDPEGSERPSNPSNPDDPTEPDEPNEPTYIVTPKASLNDYTWEEINTLALANLETAELRDVYHIEVGDYKESGHVPTAMYKYILVDDDGNDYDGFIFMYATYKSEQIHSTNNNQGGYVDADIHSTNGYLGVNGEVFTRLHLIDSIDPIIPYMKQVSIQCNSGQLNHAGNTDDGNTIYTMKTYLFLPSVAEVGFSSYTLPMENLESFDLFTDNNSRTDFMLELGLDGNLQRYPNFWLRTAKSNSSKQYAYVSSDGSYSWENASMGRMIVPTFIIGRDINTDIPDEPDSNTIWCSGSYDMCETCNNQYQYLLRNHIDENRDGICDKGCNVRACAGADSTLWCVRIEDTATVCTFCESELSSTCYSHIDINHDGTCDNCAQKACPHRLPENIRKWCCYNDATIDGESYGDGICDVCLNQYTAAPCDHVDVNNDGICDKSRCNVRVCAGEDSPLWCINPDVYSDYCKYCGEAWRVDHDLCQHIDSNKDGMCDNCPQQTCRVRSGSGTEPSPGHPTEVVWCQNYDKDGEDGWGNGLCDICNNPYYNAPCNHVDNNGDGICDGYCGTARSCPGAGSTLWCRDIFDSYWGEKGSDGYCDACGEYYYGGFTYDTCIHVDANNDGGCDLCPTTACRELATSNTSVRWCYDYDNNYDNICDVCNNQYRSAPCIHSDTNGDGICDNGCLNTVCGGPGSTLWCRDTNWDDLCDACNDYLYLSSMSCWHLDRNNDGRCDNCPGESCRSLSGSNNNSWCYNTDANYDNICDVCNNYYPSAPCNHFDNTGDGKCDSCDHVYICCGAGTTLWCRDADYDSVCDLCSEYYYQDWRHHIDIDGDGYCDDCYIRACPGGR